MLQGTRAVLPSTACGLVLAALVFAPPCVAQDSTQVARSQFDAGLTLARKHQYREAIAAFTRAYDAKPHYAVLLNIARCYLALGDTASAARYLARHLREGGDRIPPKQRRQLQAEQLRYDALMRIEQGDLAAALTDLKESHRLVPRASVLYDIGHCYALLGEGEHAAEYFRRYIDEGGTSIPPQMQQRAAARLPTAVQATTPATVVDITRPRTQRTPYSAPPAPQHDDVDPHVHTRRTWALLFGGSGLTLLTAAGTLWLWNNQRYDDWQAVDQRIPVLQTMGEPQVNLTARQTENNDLYNSIETVDVVALVLGGAGVALLGTGSYLYFTAPTAPTMDSAWEFGWRGAW